MGFASRITLETGFRITSASIGDVEYEPFRENGQWVLIPKLGETLMAKAKIDFNKETQPIDVVPERLAQLVAGREKAVKDKETAENLLNVLMKAVFQAMPIGFPFKCSRCKFDGFTVDFLTLANQVCPNCKTSGYIQIREVVPAESKSINYESAIVTDLQIITTWFNALEEKPTLPSTALQSINANLRAAGLVK